MDSNPVVTFIGVLLLFILLVTMGCDGLFSWNGKGLTYSIDGHNHVLLIGPGTKEGNGR